MLYTKRLWAGQGTERTTGPSVPVGKVWVVRCIDLVPGATGATNAYFGTEALGYFWAGQVDYPTGPLHAQWQGRQALEAGEVLVMTSTLLVAFYITGYELSG